MLFPSSTINELGIHELHILKTFLYINYLIFYTKQDRIDGIIE